MAIFFSASTCGFYDDRMKDNYVKAGSWPEDAAYVSERWYEYLIQKQSEGKRIIANEYGSPVLSDPAPPTRGQIIQDAVQKKAELLAMADAAIAPLSRAVKLGIATDKEITLLEAWERYSVMTNRVDPSDPKWETIPDVA